MIRQSTTRTTPIVRTTAAVAIAVSASLTVATPGLAHAANNSRASQCAAGSGIKNSRVDCSKSTAATLPDTVGTVLKAFGVDGTTAIAGIKKFNAANAPFVPFRSRGTATLVGSGFTAAIGAAGKATAIADSSTSAAVSIAVLGSESTAKADPFGAAVAVSLGPFFRTKGSKANARALPFGVALANSSDPGKPASATALFGWASGVSNRDKAVDGASCVALYSQASNGESSCTSVLLVLAKQTSTKKDAPTIWAVRDLFSLSTKPVVGTGVTTVVNRVRPFLGLPRDTSAKLQTKIAPVFTRDVIRLEQYPNGTVLVRSDLPGLKPFFEWANPAPGARRAGPTVAALVSPTVRSARAVRSLPDFAELSAAPALTALPAASVTGADDDDTAVDAGAAGTARAAARTTAASTASPNTAASTVDKSAAPEPKPATTVDAAATSAAPSEPAAASAPATETSTDTGAAKPATGSETGSASAPAAATVDKATEEVTAAPEAA